MEGGEPWDNLTALPRALALAAKDGDGDSYSFVLQLAFRRLSIPIPSDVFKRQFPAAGKGRGRPPSDKRFTVLWAWLSGEAPVRIAERLFPGDKPENARARVMSLVKTATRELERELPRRKGGLSHEEYARAAGPIIAEHLKEERAASDLKPA